MESCGIVFSVVESWYKCDTAHEQWCIVSANIRLSSHTNRKGNALRFGGLFGFGFGLVFCWFGVWVGVGGCSIFFFLSVLVGFFNQAVFIPLLMN